MGREEQIEEREVLESIFPNEIADVSDISYRVSIALDVPGQDEESEPPTILLTVTYPPDYPDIPPELAITAPQDASKPPHLTLPDDTPTLLSTLTSTITDSLGAAMIFTLIATLKETAETLIQTREAAVQAERDREKHRAEEAEDAKFHGEAVTRDSFLAWRARFRAEMEREAEGRKRVEEDGRSRKEIRRDEEVRVSGRELWERGLVGRVEEEGGDEERDALSGVERMRIADPEGGKGG